MNKETLKKINHKDIALNLEADLSFQSTMRLKAVGVLITCHSISACSYLIHFFQENKIQYRILGWGANQIIHNDASWVYVKIEFPLKKEYLEVYRNSYTLPANTPLSLLSVIAKKHGLRGWEIFTGIPATLGGAIAMNAGTRLGEFGQLVEEVKILTKEGTLKDIIIDKNSFKYRGNCFLRDGDFIISAKITHFGQDPSVEKEITDYLKLRNKTQPISQKTCGCVFKNFSPSFSAGQAIDSLALRGFLHKDLEISPKHCNFFENRGNATTQSFLELSGFTAEMLERFCGIKFELEVKV